MTLEEKEIKLIELCQKKFKDKVLDEEVFYLLHHIECYKYGLDNYVNGLSITKLPKLTLGTYDMDKKTIELNSKYFLKTNINNFNICAEAYDKLLCTLFHELRHAYQHKYIDENKQLLLLSDNLWTDEILHKMYKFLILELSLRLSDKSWQYYYKSYLFPHEHEANYIGTLKLRKFKARISKELPFINEIKPLLNDYQTDRIGNFLSPVEQLYLNKKDKHFISSLRTNPFLSNYEKMTFGLPIEQHIYQKITNSVNNRHKTLTYNSGIKHL